MTIPEEARGYKAVGIVWIRNPSSHEKATLKACLHHTCQASQYEVNLKDVLQEVQGD